MKTTKFVLAAIVITCLFAAGSSLVGAKTQSSPGMTKDPSPASVQAEDSYIYLPVILKPVPQQTSIAKLVAPANGAQLDTLIPILIFETEAVPDNTGGCLTFDTNPNPTNCLLNTSLSSNSQRDYVVWFNLQPSTVYYWRVGAVLNYDSNNIEWSEQRTFTTGPAGGMILPAPTLLAPGNNSTVDPSTLVLQWNAVAGAVEYDVTIRDKDEGSIYGMSGIPGSTPQVGPDRLQWIFDYATGTHFEWYVSARNDYAWGETAAPWNFSIPGKQGINGIVSGVIETRLNQNEQPVYIRTWTPELSE